MISTSPKQSLFVPVNTGVANSTQAIPNQATKQLADITPFGFLRRQAERNTAAQKTFDTRAQKIGLHPALANFAVGGMTGPVKKVASSLDDLVKSRPDVLVINTLRKFLGKPVKAVSTDSLLGQDLAGYSELDPKTVAKYVADLKAGKKLEPIKVQVSDGNIFVEDGKHRLAAARKLGVDTLEAVELPAKRFNVNKPKSDMAERVLRNKGKYAGSTPRQSKKQSLFINK